MMNVDPFRDGQTAPNRDGSIHMGVKDAVRAASTRGSNLSGCRPEQGLGRWVGSHVIFVSGFRPLFAHL